MTRTIGRARETLARALRSHPHAAQNVRLVLFSLVSLAVVGGLLYAFGLRVVFEGGGGVHLWRPAPTGSSPRQSSGARPA